MAVLGVDGCKGGWVGVVVDDADSYACFATDIGSLVSGVTARVSELLAVAIDIPIGLPLGCDRGVDKLVRARLGNKPGVVFPTPSRQVLEAESYEKANERSVRSCGKGVTRQSWALGKKILEVDAWLTGNAQSVYEVHPELSFHELARSFDLPWSASQQNDLGRYRAAAKPSRSNLSRYSFVFRARD